MSSPFPARTHLLVVDPQYDFCDLPATWWARDPITGESVSPSLPVTGAHADMQRLANWIDVNTLKLDAITITLDSHQRLDIGHPGYWRRSDGKPMQPFTPVYAEQVRSGEFLPVHHAMLESTLFYLEELESRGHYTHMVWPVHCEVGRFGHTVHTSVAHALTKWQLTRGHAIGTVFKGWNPGTEHYSALMAEVPDPSDPATMLNTRLLNALDAAETIVVAGEASSHCVRATCEHLLQYLPSGKLDRLVLLSDCMSPVPGFEQAQTVLFNVMRDSGARVLKSTEYSLI